MSKISSALHAVAGLIVALGAHAQAPSDIPADARLGPAPWFDPGFTPLQKPYATTKAVSSVGPLDTSNRAAVIAAYNSFYNVAMPGIAFTGSTASCTPGSISLGFQEWTITRINFLRAMAGVPGNTALNSSLNAQEQAASLIMARNSTLTHAPPNSMPCWTQAGADGAGSSNLAIGTGMTDSIPLYMTDPGSGNEIAGHRRWILHSRKASFGLGHANGSPYNASALYTFDFGAGPPATPNGIPWPPRGFVPLSLIPAPFDPGEGQRWSFGYPGANFGGVSVTMNANGGNIPVTVISRTDNGYGDNTVVWALPPGFFVTKEIPYTVTVSGIIGAAQTSYSYIVTPIDPVDPTPANPPRLRNISARGQVLTGADVMIAGFIIGGSTPKTVAVTVAGPSLASAGIANPLQNPHLTLVRSSDGATIATNDNWQSASNAGLMQSTGYAPAHPNEPAVLMSLAPGAYTAIVQGQGGTGIGLVGVFEVDHPEIPLTNISTRAQVGTSDNVLIAGFIVQGTGPQTVVVTVAGPSLFGAGIPNPLQNPMLTIVRASDGAVIATNDNWAVQSNPAHVALITAAGFAPAHPNEPANYLQLAPGAYTAVVQGVGNTTGVGLVGVYRVP
ncbi:hypothetical protein [Usitatibacter palustris]|uniref:Cysteine-rich secretory protein family protein n=1 Tax=Usitatibacter palustris TaxID=2732487 RepID=A0A6M4HAD7_9PROT|nr:hypothetical protein [Usitatibacter palustris]QJR16526.1 hypothetical protein DSM104440_03361 [Usitatibacter palustris]